MQNVELQIQKIGQRMLKDTGWGNFSDIDFNPKKGVIPRCLYYEKGKNKGKDVIIVGMNPGRAQEKERQYFIKNGSSYSETVKYWKENRGDYKFFYGPIRDLVRRAGITGNILWTELVKCQCKKQVRKLRLNTIRYGISKYLMEEINIFPAKTLLLAIGNDAFNLLSHVYPERKVIGITHPSQANFQAKYFYHNGAAKPEFVKIFKSQIAKDDSSAVTFSYSKAKGKILVKDD